MFKNSILALVSIGCLQVATADVIDGEDFMDPTRPLYLAAPAVSGNDVDISGFISSVIPSSWDVSFIRASGTTPMAVVNNERVRIGDTIGGAEVIEIGRNTVTLLINGEEMRVSIFDTSLKAQGQD